MENSEDDVVAREEDGTSLLLYIGRTLLEDYLVLLRSNHSGESLDGLKVAMLSYDIARSRGS